MCIFAKCFVEASASLHLVFCRQMCRGITFDHDSVLPVDAVVQPVDGKVLVHFVLVTCLLL